MDRIDNRAIGVLDSGLGGLTAVREIMSKLPEEDIIYFGDTGRVPYGSRSKETVLSYTRQDIRFLRSFDIKALVVACGTISAVALEMLSGEYDIPMIGVLRSSVYKAVKTTKNMRVGMIGTQATVATGAYEKMIEEYNSDIKVYSIPCPLFVPLVECGRRFRGDIVIETVVSDYLTPLKKIKPDCLILGCTHYPLLQDVIADFLGPDVQMINSGKEAAVYLESVLTMTEKRAAQGKQGSSRFFVSDSVNGFTDLASDYLEQSIVGAVERIEIEKY